VQIYIINPCIGSTILDRTALTFHPMQGMATGTNWLQALPFLGPKDLQPFGEKGTEDITREKEVFKPEYLKGTNRTDFIRRESLFNNVEAAQGPRTS
jgi:hypothetical protein